MDNLVDSSPSHALDVRSNAPVRQNKHSGSHRNAGDLIPLEVIESWLRGEYLVGIARSTGYQYIGWSLLLRGFYEYRNVVDEVISHWGYCYIDLKDGDLYFAGVRINSSVQWQLDEYHHPIYWRSVFSGFVGLESETVPRLYFGYLAHMLKKEESDGAAATRMSYREYCKRVGDNRQEFFEWYFKNHDSQRNLSQAEEERLVEIGAFWRGVCDDLNQDHLPINPHDDRTGQFQRRLVEYLADRSGFDADLELLEQLNPKQPILALVNLDLASVEGGTFKAALQPVSTKMKTGDFQFRRLDQPFEK